MGKIRSKAGPYFGPMFRDENDDLIHFLCLCKELRGLREEIFPGWAIY